MANPQYPIIRVDEWEMRRMFNEGEFWERTQKGELSPEIKRNTHPTRTAASEPFCTQTQEVRYIDTNGLEVARVHQYLRPDGTIGAKGRPDPKRLLKGGILYRLKKNPKPRSSLVIRIITFLKRMFLKQ